MTYDEDLKYAQDIFKMIKWFYLGIANSNPYISSTLHADDSGKSFFYYNSDERTRIFAYSTRPIDLQMSYNTGQRVVMFLDQSEFYHLDYDDGCTGIELYDDLHSEAEHFQYSLLYTPVLNRDLLTLSYIRSRKDELYGITRLEYNIELLPTIMAECKHALTFPKDRDLVGE
jgi:hypothetical protein